MNTNPIHGRGSTFNPANRFEALRYAPDPDADPEDQPAPRTAFYRDDTQTFINYNDSPDIGFRTSANPYRGCEHGCIYCYARPTHEFIGFSSGLDFESRIMVKTDAPRLLRAELSHKRWKPQVVAISGVTDCYQPAERHFKLTRQCLEVFLDYRNPVALISKNHLITRDIDLLKQLAEFNACVAFVSVTTLNAELASKMEPRASRPAHRLAAIEALAQAGIPTGVMVAPVVPVLTESEMPAILKAAAEAGARHAGYVVLRLPYAVKDLFQDWLAHHFPDRKEAVLSRIKELRGGKLNDPDFGSRMHGEGVYAKQIEDVFSVCCRRNGLNLNRANLSAAHFRKADDPQMMLFSEG